MKLKNNSKISKKNIMKKRIVKKKSLKKMREKKRKTLKRNYINKKGGNNDEIDKDVAYLMVSLNELKALKIIDGVSTNANNDSTKIVHKNPLLKNNNTETNDDILKYQAALNYYQNAVDIVEKYTANNKDILLAIAEAKRDMCEGNIKNLNKKEKNITIEDLRVEESSYLKALDKLIEVLPPGTTKGNELKIIGKTERISTDLLKTMAKCFVLLGNVNKMIGDIFHNDTSKFKKDDSFDSTPYKNKNQEELVVKVDGVRLNQHVSVLRPVNFVNYYYIISCMYYKNAHEIYFPVLGEKHWHTQVSSFFNMCKLDSRFNEGMRERLGSVEYSRLSKLVEPYGLPKLSLHSNLVNIKIVTGDNMQVTGNILDTSSLYYEVKKYYRELRKKLDDKYLTHRSTAHPPPHLVIDSSEKDEEITNFLNSKIEGYDIMIKYEHIKLNDNDYYQKYKTKKDEKLMKEIKTINKEFLSINIDENKSIDEIKSKYNNLLDKIGEVENFHTFKLLKTIHDKPPKCGDIQCGPPDIECNVKCKTHIKNEKGGITFCTDLQDKEKKKSVTGYKITRSKNQCTSSNKKIENNEIGIFHTEDAGETQKQGDLVVRLQKEITEGDEKGLFEIYLDKSK